MSRWTLLACFVGLLGLAGIVSGSIFIFQANSTLTEALLMLTNSDNLTAEKARDILTLYMPFFSAHMGLASVCLGIGIGLSSFGFAVFVFDLNNRFRTSLTRALGDSFEILGRRLDSIDCRLEGLQKKSPPVRKRENQERKLNEKEESKRGKTPS